MVVTQDYNAMLPKFDAQSDKELPKEQTLEEKGRANQENEDSFRNIDLYFMEFLNEMKVAARDVVSVFDTVWHHGLLAILSSHDSAWKIFALLKIQYKESSQK